MGSLPVNMAWFRGSAFYKGLKSIVKACLPLYKNLHLILTTIPYWAHETMDLRLEVNR